MKIRNYIITHKEFRKRVDYLGTALIDAGLKGKRIAVIGENSINYTSAQTDVTDTALGFAANTTRPSVSVTATVTMTQVD